MNQAVFRSKVIQWLIIALSLFSGLYLLVCIYLFFGQTRIIFAPDKTLKKSPQDYGLIHQELWLTISAEEVIHGWWLPSTDPQANVILFLHGNSSNIGGNLFHAKRFVEMGFSVLLMDYRGFGLSRGKFPHEKQIYEDAQVMYDYLTEERHIPADKLFVYGHSLGGAIAIELLSNNPAAGLIVEATFTSIAAMAQQKGNYSLFPLELLLHQQFDSFAKIPALTVPTLFIHGSEDATVPAEMSKALYAQADIPKKLFIVPGAEHNTVATVAGDLYNSAIHEFQHMIQQSPVKSSP